MKKLLSILLTCIMLLSLFTLSFVTAYADEENNDPVSGDPDPEPVNPFVDVKMGKWYTKGVLYCYSNGYMTGVDDTHFAPNGTTTRAMFVQILAKVAGADLTTYTKDLEGLPFKDVKAGKWYIRALKWAYENKFTSGTSETTFSPDGNVTREQVATFLYTFASKTERDVDTDATLDYFHKDAGKVAKYARKAMTWAVDIGLISGTADETLSPKDNCTRAQIALMIKKFIEYYSSECEHVWSDPSCTEGRKCTVCGYTRGTPLGHTSYATCTEDSAPCERCERIEKAYGHTAAPTCTQSAKCTRCGKEFAALGHNIKTPATCTSPSSKCTRCGYVQNALGHTTQNGKCDRCGKEVFNDKYEKLKYYIIKNSLDEEDNENGHCYDLYGHADVPVNGSDVTIYVYFQYYTSGAYRGKVTFGAAWYYDDDNGFNVEIVMPSLSGSYKFDSWVWLNDYKKYVPLAKATVDAAKFGPSYKMKFTSYDNNFGAEYKDEWQDDSVVLLDAGIRAMKKLLSISGYKDLLGGVTFKDMGFKKY